MASIREEILQLVQAKLEAIVGSSNYNFGGTLKSVERYIHVFDSIWHSANDVTPPAILIRGGDSRKSVDSGAEIGTWLVDFDIEVEFLISDDAGDAMISAAYDDLNKALFSGAEPFGIKWCQVTGLEERPFSTERGMPQDGLHLIISTQFIEQLGNPSLGV